MKDAYDAEISRLKKLKSEAEDDLKDYKKRLKQLNSIKNDIAKDFSGNIDDIYSKMNKASQTGNAGIRRTAGSDVSSVYQSGEDILKCVPNLADNNFAEINHGMSLEVTRVETKIDTLQSQINAYEQRIRSLKEAQKNSD